MFRLLLSAGMIETRTSKFSGCGIKTSFSLCPTQEYEKDFFCLHHLHASCVLVNFSFLETLLNFHFGLALDHCTGRTAPGKSWVVCECWGLPTKI